MDEPFFRKDHDGVVVWIDGPLEDDHSDGRELSS